MEIKELLKLAIKEEASDLHLTVGVPPVVRVNGILKPLAGYQTLTPTEVETLAFSIINTQQKEEFEESMELDFSFAAEGIGRFRANLFHQRVDGRVSVNPPLAKLGSQIDLCVFLHSNF